MGHKHSRDEILAAALQVAYDEGFNRLTFGRVAKQLGINDRTVVYYFPTKPNLIEAVFLAMGIELLNALDPILDTPANGYLELAQRMWPTLASPDVDPTMALFFEANGLAAAGESPYDVMVPSLVEAWIMWTADRISPPGGRSSKVAASARRAEAEAAVALLDGLLLMRQLAGPRAANRAARHLRVAP